MKKYCYIAFLAVAAVLGGCSKSPASPASDPTVTTAATTAAPATSAEADTTGQPETLMIVDPSMEATASTDVMPSGFIFTPSENIQLYMHKEASSVLKALGEPLTFLEAPSCAFQGTDRIYGFGSYELTTYEKDGKEFIYDIYFLDDSVTTDEGIYLGCSRADMEAAYGTDYEESSGSFTYTKDGMTLQFLIENDSVSAIRYNGAGDAGAQ